MFKNVFGLLAASSQVYTFRAMQYIWVSKDAEFYVDSKNINLY
jgi:hypothetical protein